MDISSFLVLLPLDQSVALVSVSFLFLLYGALSLRTKRFYFVRHGQTLLNARMIRQGPEGELSETGKKQAEAAGKYLTPLHIQRIIASPYERTRETADIINSHLHVHLSYSPLLVERKNPSEVIGRKADDALVRMITDKVDLSYHTDDYRYSDEENFLDLKARSKACLSFLSGRFGTRFCVVTHSFFLKALVGYLLYRDDLHAEDHVKLSFFNPSSNGGITICEYRPLMRFLSATKGWSVVAYNQDTQ